MYWITGALGIVALFAPFVFGYTFDAFATWTSLIAGMVLLATSLIEGAAEDTERWEYWVDVAVGVAVVAAPFVFNFRGITEALWISIGVGIITMAVAGGKLLRGGLR